MRINNYYTNISSRIKYGVTYGILTTPIKKLKIHTWKSQIVINISVPLSITNNTLKLNSVY